jgi:hypothetical protein
MITTGSPEPWLLPDHQAQPTACLDRAGLMLEP